MIPIGSPSDEQLAEIVGRREQSERARRLAHQAYQELYNRHAGKLLAFLASRASRNEFQDVNQEVWARVWNSIGKFQGGNFRAWLHQIARNYLVDQARKRKYEPLGEKDDLLDSGKDRPEAAAIQQEEKNVLRRCLEKLDGSASELIRARLAGESYADICQRLGLKPEQAHKQFHTAKEQLQSCVERANA